MFFVVASSTTVILSSIEDVLPHHGWGKKTLTRKQLFGIYGIEPVSIPPTHQQRVEDGDSEDSGADNENLIQLEDLDPVDDEQVAKYVEQQLRVKFEGAKHKIFESVRKAFSELNQLTREERLQNVAKSREKGRRNDDNEEEDDDDNINDIGDNNNNNNNDINNNNRRNKPKFSSSNDIVEEQPRVGGGGGNQRNQSGKIGKSSKSSKSGKREISDSSSSEPSVSVSPIKPSSMVQLPFDSINEISHQPRMSVSAPAGDDNANANMNMSFDESNQSSQDQNRSFTSDVSMGGGAALNVSVGSDFAPDSADGNQDFRVGGALQPQATKPKSKNKGDGADGDEDDEGNLFMAD